MIVLYQFASSPFTEKVRRALNYKGLPFDTHEVDRKIVSEGDYDHVSPTRKFPAITDGQKNIWDSTDILHHLDRAYPSKPVIPLDKNLAALAHIIEDWADESLYFYEILMRAGWEHNLDNVIDIFAASMPHVPRDQVKPVILSAARGLAEAQGVGRKPADQVKADVERHFQAIDTRLEAGAWLVGDDPGIADFAVAGQINALLFAEEARESLGRTRHVEAWLQRLDSVAPVHLQGDA